MSNLAVVEKYETAFGTVELSIDTIKKYLVKGSASKVTDQECAMFLNLCKFQRLNPFVNEAYLIKFGDDAQMVVGYGAYKRRAEENPAFKGLKDGIIVMRGDAVVQKEGVCLYPGETLIGGWCRVLVEGKEDVYREVSLAEYDKNQAEWKTKKATMINKVAVSQALRTAFPKDYEGLYSDSEIGPVVVVDEEPEVKITKEERQKLFAVAKAKFGKEYAVNLKGILADKGISGTQDMTVSQYEEVLEAIKECVVTTGETSDDVPPLIPQDE